MDSKPDASHSRQRNLRYIAPIVLIALVAIGLYLYTFPDGLSDKSEAWGQFGDFLGGLLNPLIGLITVLLVLRTLRVTLAESARTHDHLERQTTDLARQLALAHAQDARNREAAELAELQKCLDETVRLLSIALNEKVPQFFMVGVNEDGSLQFTDQVTSKERVVVAEVATGSLKRLRLLASQGNDHYRSQFQAHKPSWLDRFSKERFLLKEMVAYVKEYDAMASHPWVSTYYKRRAYPVAVCLAVLSQFDQSDLEALRPPEEPALPIQPI